MRYDDGIAERCPADVERDIIRRSLRIRTEMAARKGRRWGVYCHDLPQYGPMLPERMAEVLCSTTSHVINAARDEQRLGGFQLTRAGRPRPVKGKSGPTGRPVECVETGECYGSLVIAAAAVGCSHSAIFMAIKRNGRCRNLRWRYADEAKERAA